ncbi:MAG: Mini-ribonuclease 3 [Fusobacteriota bacterium]
MEYKKIKELNNLALAYLGDAKWELEVRNFFVKKNYKVKKLNNLVRKYVRGNSQSKIYELIKDNLSERAKYISKRARNSKIKSCPKSCTYKEYKNATAFEALIAYYYYTDQEEKIKNILKKGIEGEDDGKRKS